MELNLPFLTIALVVITALLVFRLIKQNKQNQPLYFNDNERQLHQAFFNELEPKQFDTLMKIALWRDMKAGDVLIKQGEKVDCLSLVVEGRLCADLGKNTVATLTRGQFIGEMSFVSGNLASVTVVAEDDTQLVQWPQDELKELLANNSELSSFVQSLFQRDLIRKLSK